MPPPARTSRPKGAGRPAERRSASSDHLSRHYPRIGIRRASEVVERGRVRERARERRVVRGEGPDLEVLPPGGVGRYDPDTSGGAEAEAAVVDGAAEQGDERLPE